MKIGAYLGSVILCVSACQDPGNTKTVDVEANDLGVVRVEIQHETTADGDRLLTIRGVDADDQEIASSTLRTGMVLYSPEPDLMPAGWSAGTELTAAMGADTFDNITPDRMPHLAALPYQPTLTTFLRLNAVGAAIKAESGIWFSQATDEVALSATTCTSSAFPTPSGAPQQCCVDTYSGISTSYHKIASNAPKSPNLLATRTYGNACTLSNGSTDCNGTGCYFGPCGASANGATGNTAAVVFYPNSDPTRCGRDGTGGGTGVPENFTGQTKYAGLAATCPYVTCCYDQFGGTSVPSTTMACPYCGDGFCNASENTDNCPQDCLPACIPAGGTGCESTGVMCCSGGGACGEDYCWD